MGHFPKSDRKDTCQVPTHTPVRGGIQEARAPDSRLPRPSGCPLVALGGEAEREEFGWTAVGEAGGGPSRPNILATPLLTQSQRTEGHHLYPNRQRLRWTMRLAAGAPQLGVPDIHPSTHCWRPARLGVRPWGLPLICPNSGSRRRLRFLSVQWGHSPLFYKIGASILR